MSDHVSLGYPAHICFLPSWKCVDNTLKLTAFLVQQHTGTSGWGILYRCKTCLHDIWGSWYTPSTPKGFWTYLFPLLWPILTHSFVWPRPPSWYSRCQSGRGNVNVPVPSRGVYFLIPGFLRLVLWIPLVPVPLGFHKLLMQNLMHTHPFFRHHRVVFLRLKYTAQASRFYWWCFPRHAHECPVMEASAFWLYCFFYWSDILLWSHFDISDQ